jgi:hypothetical protein
MKRKIAQIDLILSGSVEKPFCKVAVFEDLFGNLWDLIEPK